MGGPGKSIRDYDSERVNTIALAMWEALLTRLRDDEGRVYLPMREVMDASAMLLGLMLSTAPEARVPSQLRRLCDDHAKRIIKRTHDAAASDAGRVFDVVMVEDQVMQ